MMNSEAAKRTPLYDEHVALGARMVPFAGYDMPVQYPAGIMAEHNWTRDNAGLFDVSHMGQCFVTGADFATVATALERIVPADVKGLVPGQQRYSQLLADDGGILDDLMITHALKTGAEGPVYVVVNAARKEHDFGHITALLPQGLKLIRRDDLALVALQGPKAEAVMAKLAPELATLPFMRSAHVTVSGMPLQVSRSGYTGEDGYEISVRNEDAVKLWRLLLADERVKPVGLGARDSLRLEGGLCLYGHDIDETTSPVEAGLMWSIARHRRAEANYPGAGRVSRELAEGVSRKRVGLKPAGRAPARDGTDITNAAGEKIGTITSGGFGPTVGGPVAMGYVASAFAAPGTPVNLMVRGQAMPATVVALPFVPNRFKR